MSEIILEIFLFTSLIFLGIFLNYCFNNTYLKKSLKFYILNIALPTTIFISVISLKIQYEYFFYPLIFLLFNFLVLTISNTLFRILNVEDLKKKRTLILLLPSFAPGLSCFTIINEFLGYDSLAKASLIDFGNKIFVLIILFFIAIGLHKQNQKIQSNLDKKKLGPVLKNLFYEPINIVIFIALLFLLSNNSINDMPNILISLFERIKTTLAPAVFLFVGISMIFEKKYFLQILPILFIRAGICLLLVLSIIRIFNLKLENEALLYLILSLSSVSFWPFVHMTFIEKLEKKLPLSRKTFDLKFGLIFLAYSLPFSTILIMGLFICEETLTDLMSLFLISISLIMIGFLILKISKKKALF